MTNTNSSTALNLPSLATMIEADRVRQHWKKNAASVTAQLEAGKETHYEGTPTLPRRYLFDSYPAFSHAYSGKNGGLQFLLDYCGPKGNTAYCGHQGWILSPGRIKKPIGENEYYSCAEVDKEYKIDMKSVRELIEKMSDKKRREFRAAVEIFVAKILPDIAHRGDRMDRYEAAHSTAILLSDIIFAVAYSAGGPQDPQSCAIAHTLTYDELYKIAMKRNANVPTCSPP